MTNIGQHRLYAQSISAPRFEQVAEVVAWMGAMQAQDYDGARWSIGLRLAGSRVQDVEAALAAGQIVRTWPMRGTLHLVAAEDVHWMLKLMTPRVLAASAGRHRQLELDASHFQQSGKLFRQALGGGNCLPRQTLLDLLTQAGIRTDGQRGYHLLGWHAQQGLICLGPKQGKQPTFVLLDEWVKQRRDLDGEAALAEISRRFFLSHGPATVADLSRWTGLTLTAARQGLAAIKAGLTELQLGGESYWLAPELALSTPTKTPTVHLLPGFDEYLLGYKNRDAVLDPAHAQRICPGNNGMFVPTLLIDGQVRGTWKRQVKKKAVRVDISPFGNLTASEKAAIEPALTSYGAFLELPAEVHYQA